MARRQLRRVEVDEWWRSPIASIVLVVSGLVVIGVEVWRSADDWAGYSTGLALIGLGITGKIQTWAIRKERDDDT